MTNIDIIKLSSKGQIVIPSSMRKDLNEGENLVIIKDEDRIILKKANDITEKIKEDLEFAKRTEEAWEAYERGEFISQSADDFLEDLEKC
jgi:AbrB family looped-hinge helix DNA binding protein